MKLKILLKDINYHTCYFNNYKLIEENISGIYFSTTKIVENSLYICNFCNNLDSYDSHNFIDIAYKKGAIVVFLECYHYFINFYPDIIFFLCSDIRIISSKLIFNFFELNFDNLKFIGISGTNGKTTVSYLLNSILNSLCNNSLLIGTLGIFYNNKKLKYTGVTTPEEYDLFLYLKKFLSYSIKYIILEISSHSLKLFKINNFSFQVVSLLNIKTDHFDFHYDYQEYEKTKFSILNYLSNKGRFLSNCYFKKILEIRQEKNEIFKNKKIDFFIFKDFFFYKIIFLFFSGFTYKIIYKLFGNINIENIMSVINILISLEFDLDNIIKNIEKLINVPGRFNRILISYYVNFPIIFIDFAHNFYALYTFFENIKKKFDKFILSLFGSGGNRDFFKRPLMSAIILKYSHISLFTSDNIRNDNLYNIMNDMFNKKKSKKKILLYINRKKALLNSLKLINKQTILVILGRGVENYLNIGESEIKLNESNIIIKYFKIKKK